MPFIQSHLDSILTEKGGEKIGEHFFLALFVQVILNGTFPYLQLEAEESTTTKCGGDTKVRTM